MSDEQISITITPNADAIEAWSKATRGIIKPAEFNRALSRAINRTIAEVRTEAFKQATSQYTIKSKDISNTVRTTTASPTSLSAEARFTGGRIPLLKFIVKPAGGFSFKGMSRQGRPQLFVQIRKDGGGPADGLFAAKLGEATRIYSRSGKEKFPIKSATGPSIVSMVGNEEAVAAIQGRADIALSKRLDHEMKRVLEK